MASPDGLMLLLDTAAEQVQRRIAKLGEHSGVFRLIHGDLHGGNVLLQAVGARHRLRRVRLHHCLYDLATVLHHLSPRHSLALLHGRKRARRLSDGDTRQQDRCTF